MWYSWQILSSDVVEVSLISSLVYVGLRWLQRDDDNRLLVSVYSYWALMALAWLGNLSTLFNGMLIGLPFLISGFLLFHKEQLQKNFVQRIIPKRADFQEGWIDVLMRSLLYAMNQGIACAVIIENKDPLALDVPFVLDAHLSIELMHLIEHSAHFDAKRLLYLTNAGRVVGFNAQPKGAVKSQEWHFDAIMITQKTDAFVVGVDPVARSFVVIAQGKHVDGVNVKSVVHMLKHYIFGKSLEEGKELYASNLHKKSMYQDRA